MAQPLFFKSVLRDKYLRAVFGLSFLILIICFCLVMVLLPWGKPIVIHYDASRGLIDFVGTKLQVVGIIFAAGVMVLVNFLLSDFLYLRERFLSFLLGFFSLMFGILILIGISVILSVN